MHPYKAVPHSIVTAISTSILFLTGCQHVALTTRMPNYIYANADSAPSRPAAREEFAAAANNISNGFAAIDSLYDQVRGNTTATHVTTEGFTIQSQPLYPVFAQTLLIKKYATELHERIHSNDVETVPQMKVSPSEIKTFFTVFSANFAEMFSDPVRVQARLSATTVTLDEVLRVYYEEYFDGNYVTRDGIKLTKPGATASFSNGQLNGSVNNDTITGLITVYFEALLDYFERVPINPETYNSKNVPTGIKRFPKLIIIGTENAGDPQGLTQPQWKNVNYASSATASGAQALTSLIIKNIGGTNLGFAVAYLKLSIGDNTTFTKMIDTALLLTLKRDAEWTLFHVLKGNLKTQSRTMSIAQTSSNSLNAVWGSKSR